MQARGDDRNFKFKIVRLLQNQRGNFMIKIWVDIIKLREQTNYVNILISL